MAKDAKQQKKRKSAPVFLSGMRGPEPVEDLDPDDDAGDGEGQPAAPPEPEEPTRPPKRKGKAKARDAYSSGMRGGEQRPAGE